MGDDEAEQSYRAWVARYDTPDEDARRAVERRLASLDDPPSVSIVMPVFDTPEPLLRAALDSAREQWYPGWELCAVDDGSTAPWISEILTEFQALDPRIVIRRHPTNLHISAASNTGLHATSGRWVTVLDHDDVLAPHALALAALALSEHPEAGLLYSDEDHLDGQGARCDPYFKPDFDPVLLLGQNYLAHLCLLRRDLVEAAGGYREGLAGSQDWDLALRVVERLRPDQVVHVPHVLYHWRAHGGSTASSTSVKPYALEAGRAAVAEHLARTGHPATVRTTAPTGFTRVEWSLPDPVPSVSLVMVSRTGSPLRQAVESVLQRTDYPRFTLSVVTADAEDDEAGRYLHARAGWVNVVAGGDADHRLPAERDVLGPLLRAGVDASEGEILCFLHDDVEVVGERWLAELVGVLSLPGVAAAGATLLSPEGYVRHAGYRLDPSGGVHDAQRGLHRLDVGYFGQAGLARCVTALSSAAMVVRRQRYQAVGGHAPHGASDVLADVDLCRRLTAGGGRCVVTPHAELLHHECDPVAGAPETEALVPGWQGEDPSSNPNLAADGRSLAWPPRNAVFRPLG